MPLLYHEESPGGGISSLARDLAAFANSSGGKILLGVCDDGKVVGVRDSNKLRPANKDSG